MTSFTNNLNPENQTRPIQNWLDLALPHSKIEKVTEDVAQPIFQMPNSPTSSPKSACRPTTYTISQDPKEIKQRVRHLIEAGQIDEVLEILTIGEDERWKYDAISDLVPKLTNPLQFNHALKVLSTLKNEYWKAGKLENFFIPHLASVSQIPQILRMADTFTDKDLEKCLHPFIVEKLCKMNEIDEAFKLTNTMTDLQREGFALETLATHISNSHHIDQFLALIADQRDKTRVLKALAENLIGLNQIDRALQIIDRMDSFKDYVLKSLANKLTDSIQLTQAIALAKTISNQIEKFNTLGILGRKKAELENLSSLRKICPLFGGKIEQRNEKKNKEAPIAVVIISDDADLRVLDPGLQYSMAEIAKTHYITLQTLTDGRLFGAALTEAIKSIPENEDLSRKANTLIVSAHGCPRGMQFGEEFFYTWQMVKEADYTALTSDASIHLLSCRVGECIGPLIAKNSDRVVYAPKEEIYHTNIFFEQAGDSFVSGQHNEYYYDFPFRCIPSMFCFKPDGGEEPIDSSQHKPEDRLSKWNKYAMKL